MSPQGVWRQRHSNGTGPEVGDLRRPVWREGRSREGTERGHGGGGSGRPWSPGRVSRDRVTGLLCRGCGARASAGRPVRWLRSQPRREGPLAGRGGERAGARFWLGFAHGSDGRGRARALGLALGSHGPRWDPSCPGNLREWSLRWSSPVPERRRMKELGVSGRVGGVCVGGEWVVSEPWEWVQIEAGAQHLVLEARVKRRHVGVPVVAQG